jgi:hypothetical protein
MKSIYDFVKQQRDDYHSDTIEIVEGYDFSQYETLKTIELYHNSRFISGNKDSLGREKPFYNIPRECGGPRHGPRHQRREDRKRARYGEVLCRFVHECAFFSRRLFIAG